MTPSQQRQPQVLQLRRARAPGERRTAQLIGSLPLARRIERREPGGQVAPPPPSASVGRGHHARLDQLWPDAFGNVASSTSETGGASCVSTNYDPTYAQLPVVSTAYVGVAGSNGCGQTQLVTTAQYDRGLAAVTNRTGPNGEIGKADYDELARVIDEFAPDPVNVGQLSGAPSVTYQYFVTTNATTQPWSLVHAATQAGATAAATQVHDSWLYVDALGRKLARLEQADPSAGDGGSWLVTDFVDFDAQGTVAACVPPLVLDGQCAGVSARAGADDRCLEEEGRFRSHD